MSNENFPVDKFNEALLETKKVKARLAPFIAEFLNNNIKWVYEAFNLLHIYINKPAVNLFYKFNALNAIRVLFDTADFLLVNWIEVFFIPKITKIVLKYVKELAKERGKYYFFDEGYTQNDDPNIQKYGYNYIILALELMQIAAQVKPYRLFQIQQTPQPSEFFQSFQLVKRNGYEVPKQLLIYKKPQDIKNQIQKYQNNLKKLAEQQQSPFFQHYEGFCYQKLQQFLNEKQHNQQKNYEISILKVYESGDLIVSSGALEQCKANLTSPSDLIKVKNAIYFFHRAMISADYQTFYSLHNQQTLVTLFQRLIYIQNCRYYTLQRGKKFLIQFKNPNLSQQVYCYFLQCFQKWSIFATSFLNYQNKNDDNNQMKALCQSLIKKFKLQFPQPKNFESQLKQFKENIKRNRQRNQILIQDIQQKDSQLKKIILQIQKITEENQQSNKNISQQKSIKTNQKQINNKSQNSEIKIEQTPLGYQGQNHQFLQKTKKAEQILKKLNSDQINYVKNREFLKQYSDTLDHELESLPEDLFNDNFERSLQLKQNIITVLKNDKKYQIQQNKNIYNSSNINIKPINIQQLGYSNQNNLDTPVKKINFQDNQIQFNSKNTNLSKRQIQFIPNQQKKIIKSQKQLNKNNLGYDAQRNEQKIQKVDYNHLRYPILSQNLNVQNQQESKQSRIIPTNSQNQIESRGIQGQQKMKQSNKIKKTQNLVNSRKTETQSIKKKINSHTYDKQQSDVKPYRQNQKSVKQTESVLKHKKLQDIALEEQFEENLSINKPKQFKSLGRYKIETQNKLPSLPKIQTQKQYESRVNFDKSQASLKNSIIQEFSPQIQVRNPSIISSNKNGIQNLGYSQSRIISHYNQQEQEMIKQFLQDEINVPLCQPMEESFHEIGQLEQRIRGNAVPSFKKCFQTDKYIIPQDKNTKMYWLEDATRNLIRTGAPQHKKSRIKSTINVPQILQERNKKYQNQLKHIQQDKNRKIRQLQSKIQNLQNETVNMKGQIIVQKQQIKTLKANSDFDKESTGQKGYLLDMENIAAQKFASPIKLGYGNQKQFDASFYKESMYLDPTGRLINSKNYKGYFEQFKRQKQKKGLLKNKELLHKDKQIQIGYMVRKQSEQLVLTFYITPEIDICSLIWKVNENENLKIESQPKQSIPYIRNKKQEKVYLTIDITRTPYNLPEIQFSYEPDLQSQQKGKMRYLKLLVPCAFHKFFLIKDISQNIESYFSNKEEVIRGEQVPYSKKILKNLDAIREYFPTVHVLNKGIPNDKGQLAYGGMAYYQNIKFPIKICIKPNQFLYIQVNKYLSNQRKSEPIIQFYLCLLTHLLMKDIQ